LLWHEVVKSEIAKGTGPEAILQALKYKDRDLAYLDKLGKDEYARELVLLNNSINGIAGIKPL